MKRLRLAAMLISALALPFTIALNAQASEQSQVQKAEGVWIDVRSAEEFARGHLSGAQNVTHKEIGAKIAQISPNKDAPIHLYCRSGSRAEMALQELKKQGYRNVTNHGGYEALLKQGLK